MEDIKFGLKLWSTNKELFLEAEALIKQGAFHYIELLVVPGTDISPFLRLKVPYIIHAAHEHWNVNIADDNKEKQSQEVIQNAIQWANKLKAMYIVLHPGFGNISVAKKFLSKISDSRILIENMPKLGMNGEFMIGINKEELNILKGDIFGFCLDLNHAMKAANSLKIQYKEYILELLQLNPNIFHISDGILSREDDDHLNIGKGEYDMDFLSSCIKKNRNKYVTLETPRENKDSLKEALEDSIKLQPFFLSNG